MKSIKPVFSLLLLILSSMQLAAQVAQTPAPEEVVKITSKLVQFDAVVTDKEGKQVTDLKSEDFEIFEDGKPRRISYFSYVNTDPSVSEEAAGTGRSESRVATRTACTPGRLITFIVDDGNCSASQLGMVASREALEKFIKEQMLPTDRVAIYQTRSGSSVFQQYTTDKGLLLRAVKKVRWFPPAGPCAGDGTFYPAARVNTFDKMTPEGLVTRTIESDSERRVREANEDSSRANQVVGTLGVLRYVIRGLGQVGGRKIVFFLSDGMTLRSRTGTVSQAFMALRDITDLANRASVIFNTIDVRGLFDTSAIEARDAISTLDDATATETIVNERTQGVRRSQDGLHLLASETGGAFYHSQNFLDKPLREALNLEKGYYLLAYEPDDDTFKGKTFNKIDIRTRRPSLKVHSRAGFIGAVDPAPRKKKSEDSDLYQALIAPLPRAGLNLRLTAFFGKGVNEGNYVRSLTYVDGADLSFYDQPGGIKAAKLDVVAVTLNEKNEVVDEFNRTHTFKVPAEAIPTIKANGFVYSSDVPIKKPGTYTFRVALRDGTSTLIGSASQVVQVPDIGKKELVLSGLTVTEASPNGSFVQPSAADPDKAIAFVTTPSVPAIRRFRPGAILAYSYTLYNVVSPKTGRNERLTIQTNLYRNGELISEGKPQPADLRPQTDWTTVSDFGYMRLGANAASGDYALEIIVRDSAGTKSSVAREWIDFEVTS